MTAGTPLVNVVATHELKAVIKVPQTQIASDLTGHQLSLQVEPENKSIQTVVKAMVPLVDVTNQQVSLLSYFDNKYTWLPGSSVQADILLENLHKVMMVAAQAVVTRNNQFVVFEVDKSGQQVRARPVTLGITQDERLQILTGINEGSQIVVEGANQLSDGSYVTFY